MNHVKAEGTVPIGTLTQLFTDTVDRLGGRVAYMNLTASGPAPVSYEEVQDTVRRGSSALLALGLERGDRAAILSENRLEWPLADFACLCAGVIDVPIYSTLTAAQISYILEDSKATLVFVSDAVQLEKVQQAARQLSQPVRSVVFDSSVVEPGILTWDEFLQAGNDDSIDAFRSRALEADPDDIATLIYTSGTTGDPKGVMLTHNNLASNINAADQILPVHPTDSTVSFLPLSHVLQRMVDYLFFSGGCVITHCSIDQVSAEMKRVRPTKVVSVPRLYEKVYQAVMGGSGLKGRLARWAAGVGRKWMRHKEGGGAVPMVLGLQHRLADKLVFSKIRKGLGGRLEYFVSGGAPLAPEINRFFAGAGVTILEGYGLTETSPLITVNTLEHLRIGTVGKPVAGTEIRIADDGEILIAGPQVMKGYYGLPDKTQEVLEDGWFATGDIGELSEDGFLRITDRKKDLIKTSGGKYIAPQSIENRLKKNPFIDQAVVVGEGRKFCSVLIVPAFDYLGNWARSQGRQLDAPGQLIEDELVQEEVSRQVFLELDDLARYEIPKKIALLPGAFTVEDGSLTPTQKIKRKVVQERHQSLIESFYDSATVDQTVFVGVVPSGP